ncbi:N-acetylglucosamine-6-phosphate deacetylase [Virgibacillus halodenitrificans]|uniref:N-acetylglucosamine-6-phosphate deacetylase n=1 Tax=Virgibacillus halodenitrificans TaxID=1482 RepID=UPI00136A7668|nr:N-acetylglucosamine-6-phosphate deacetylase [Virgibacillus halodenitrificans]MYL44685.1 N-acetylglucosamine-6-phosphate deacetylase [Virgibacillus halodenitrificans]
MKSIVPIYIKNAKIYQEDKIINKGGVLIEHGKIAAVHENIQEELPTNVQIIDGTGLQVIPGFIDGHIHGADGADVMDATEAALDTMAAVLPREGTTSFLATTITQAPENIDKALENIAHYKNKAGFAEMVGVHLEGPFIEETKAGAQPLDFIMEPNIEQFNEWQEKSGNKIKTITMAPEHDADGSFINHLYRNGVNVSAGHTGTDFAGMKQAVSYGVRQVTHLCNAMSGIHHRDIGVVGAAFQLEELRAELIADGIHISPEMLEIIYENVGSERLILITDAMRAKCLNAGNYELGGQPVTVTEDRAVLENGTLAGSILKMHEGARQMLKINDVTMRNIIQMASENPARQLNFYDRKGSIEAGKDADVLLVDDNLNINYTICRGVIAYKGGE